MSALLEKAFRRNQDFFFLRFLQKRLEAPSTLSSTTFLSSFNELSDVPRWCAGASRMVLHVNVLLTLS